MLAVRLDDLEVAAGLRDAAAHQPERAAVVAEEAVLGAADVDAAARTPRRRAASREWGLELLNVGTHSGCTKGAPAAEVNAAEFGVEVAPLCLKYPEKYARVPSVAASIPTLVPFRLGFQLVSGTPAGELIRAPFHELDVTPPEPTRCVKAPET